MLERLAGDKSEERLNGSREIVQAIQITVGAFVGTAIAWLYFRMLSRQVDALVGGKMSAVMGGFLARLALVGTGMALMMWWGPPAGAATAVAFIVAQRIVIFRHKRTTLNGDTTA